MGRKAGRLESGSRARPAGRLFLCYSYRGITATERWHDIDVTNYVRARRTAGPGTIGFAVVPQDTAGALWAFFHSREADDGKPRLLITPAVTVSPRRAR